MERSTHSTIKRIAFIGNYQPRQCGIATFTTDLCESIADEYKDTACIALPVNDTKAGYEYPSRVRFELTEKDIESYRRIFGPGVRFDCQLSGLSFSATWLAQAIAGADPARCERLTRVLQRAQSRGPLGFTEEVQCVLHQLLPGGAVSAEGVARWFGISERTLRHRLQGENTRLQQLLAETRFEVARNLLRNTRLPMSQIAAALCYTDAAVFSRAFHGWAGVSPRQWRAALA